MFTVADIRPETPSITTIVLRDGDMTPFAKRRAGQFARLQVMLDGTWTEEHPFTLSNAPEDGFLQMTIKSLGRFTSGIRAWPMGTQAHVRGPFGKFCAGADSEASLTMIAGGIGITPFLSVLRHFRNTGAKNKVKLIWANNAAADLFAHAELAEFCDTLDFSVVHVILDGKYPDRAGAHAHPKVSFETGLLTRELLAGHVTPGSAALHVCGSPNMQQFVLQRLEECSVDPATVDKEQFVWNAPGANKA